MSSPRSLIINCGASHITAAVFSEKGDSLVLEEIASQNLEYDYSVDAEWLSAVLAATQELASQHRVKGPATVIFPSYQLLTKNIKVPHVDASRQQQIIAFEAQQNIPYPLDEVEWDHQIIADDGVETEVTLIAVKKDIAERFCTSMTNKGVTPIAVQAASILDYNAYRYCYASEDEPTLLINVGARSSNLIFISNDGFFVSTIPLGGNSLTQSIADNLGKSFTQAEATKTAFFTGQTSFTSDDSSVQILQSNAEAFLKRMSQEITRRIVAFRRQKRGQVPTRILLTGRGALLPGLPEYLSEQQKMSVEYFDPTRCVELGNAIDSDTIQKEQYTITEVLGVASNSKIDEPVGINLLPERIEGEMTFSRKKPFLILAAAALAISVAPPFLYFSKAKEAYQAEVAQYSEPTLQLQNLHNEILETNDKAETIKANIDALYDLRASKNNWINFMADIMTRLQDADDVWLTSMKVVRENPASTGNRNRTEVDTQETEEVLYRLNLGGVLLLREYDPDNPNAIDSAEAASRVNNLLRSFTESEFVSEVTDKSFDNTSNVRLLKFEFALIIDPTKQL